MKRKVLLKGVLMLLIATVVLAGCTKKEEEVDYSVWTYSDGIDETGFWTSFKALDYVELSDYSSLTIPYDVHNVSEDKLKAKINELVVNNSESMSINSVLTDYPDNARKVTDRVITAGDLINIDYVGSVDGVEFSGGNTDGEGTNVIIGITSYIDDFLEQLVGHKPGETIDVNVTFPEVYSNNPDLAGKEALFVVTINYIIEVDITDAFVVEHIYSEDGTAWKTVQEMKGGLKEQLKETAINDYIKNYLENDISVKSIPQTLVTYHDNSLVKYMYDYATMYSVELEEFLQTYVGVDSVAKLIESEKENNNLAARYALVSQAIAEDAGFVVTDEDLANYFLNNTGSADYSSYETNYGLAYIKQIALQSKVYNHIYENVVLGS